MSTQFEFIYDLTALDDRMAEFTSDQHDATFGLPVAYWLELGRPGVLTVKVESRG